jgi:DNA-directed RNA polymerase II subunit RPB2
VKPPKNPLASSDKGRSQRRTIILSKIYLGKFPIMLHSDFCVLKGLPLELRHTMGECLQRLGRVFHHPRFRKNGRDPREIRRQHVVGTQRERHTDDDGNVISATEYLYSADIRSVSENVSKPIRNLSVQIVAPTASYTNRHIVVNVPNVRKPVPSLSSSAPSVSLRDKAIIEMCLLDLDKYEHMIDVFAPSVHDAGSMMTQALAI